MGKKLYPMHPVLLIDDEPDWLSNFSLLLMAGGISNVVTAGGGPEGLAVLAEKEVSVVVLDLNMPGIPGQDVLVQIKENYPGLKVVMMTGVDQAETAVSCLQSGAFDYFVKSSESGRLVNGVKHAIEFRDMAAENRALMERLQDNELRNPDAFSRIVTRNRKMLGIFRYLEAVAPSSRPVLVVGETGTGKELIARAVHDVSGVSGEFVAVNCAGLDDNLFSDTLFGHRKGAYTGANDDRPGLIERAAGGTLFLDEIGDLSATSQVKLLRLLEQREYLPLGADFPSTTDARIVAATNQDLRAGQNDGGFRRDLYYRLRTHNVSLPPLRERPEDLALLMECLVARAAESLRNEPPEIPSRLLQLLRSYSFPGNVRELEAVIFDAVSRAAIEGELSIEFFEDLLVDVDLSAEPEITPQGDGRIWATFSDPLPTMKEVKQLLVDEALHRTGGSQSAAAKMVGLTRQAINRRIQDKENEKNG